MEIIRKRGILIIVTIVLFCGSNLSKGELEINFKHKGKMQQTDDQSYFGKWKVVKYVLGNAPSALTQEEVYSFIGKEIIVDSKFTVLFSDSCKLPVYKTHVENTQLYLYNNYNQENSIGIKQKTITVVEVDCAIPPVYANNNSPNFAHELLLINKNELIMDYLGVFFVFKRMSSTDNIKRGSANGDTVQCYMGAKCSSTGYVIQGTRAKGHLVHVSPINKNVPMEKVNKQSLKRTDEDK